MEKEKKQASDVDIGATIYNDDSHGRKGTAMKVGYSIFSPVTAINDFVVYLFE
jgi:hypothetical protein